MLKTTASLLAAAVAAVALVLAVVQAPSAESARASLAGDGIVRVKSAYPFDETIVRLKQDVAAKGIVFFSAVDQAKLAADAGIRLNPSTLLTFGNPPLGTLFITANPNAGLDWPVRLLVTQDDAGVVHAVYTDFAWIARRHGITNRDGEFAMASKVIGSITGSVAK